jgi:hypothetical protein
MSTCDCRNYADLELTRSAVSRRIRETKRLENRLELVHDSEAEHRLYRCPVCTQLWQCNRAWNWENNAYLFRVPSISLVEWLAEPFQAPDEMLIYSAVMSDFFEKNDFSDGDRPCQSPNCPRLAARRVAHCVQHHVESLQKLGNLPKEPTGRLFPPYSRKGAA